MRKIEIGDLWWDKYRAWSGGSDYLNFVYIVLSRDNITESSRDWNKDFKSYTISGSVQEKQYYRVAQAQWCDNYDDSGIYLGMGIRHFLGEEVRKMVYVGSIKSIKRFNVFKRLVGRIKRHIGVL